MDDMEVIDLDDDDDYIDIYDDKYDTSDSFIDDTYIDGKKKYVINLKNKCERIYYIDIPILKYINKETKLRIPYLIKHSPLQKYKPYKMEINSDAFFEWVCSIKMDLIPYIEEYILRFVFH